MSDLAPAASPSVLAAAARRRRGRKPLAASSRAPPFRSWWWRSPGKSRRISASSRASCFRRWKMWPRPSFASPPTGSCRTTCSTRSFASLAGFALAAVAGVAIGFAMGRSRRAEDIFLPLVSIGAPIPGLAYAPLFLLWFGLGNMIGRAAGRLRLRLSRSIFNTWTGREGGQGNLGALGAGDGRGQPAAASSRRSCRARCPTSSPGCGSAWRRPGASWSAWRCSPRCRGGSAG